MIKLENLTKDYKGAVRALEDITLEVVCAAGPSPPRGMFG